VTAAKLSFVEATRIIEPGTDMNKTARRFADVVVDSQSLYAVVRSEGLDFISAILLDYPHIARPAVSRLLGDEPPDAPAGRVALYICPECGDLGCGAVTVKINRSDDKVEWSAWGYQNNYEDDITPLRGFADVTFRRQDYERVLRALLARMAPEPTWPVFCLDGDDVIVVRSAAEVPVVLDPVLVDEPVKLIDSKGRRLRKVISEPQRRRRFFRPAPEIVAVQVDEDEADHSELLRRTLMAYLSASGVEVEPAQNIESFARTAAALIS
jgi:hypothetical protein